MTHVFGDCELDEALFQLRRRGEVVKLEPKVFDVLIYLLRHRDRVVSKDELLDAVWPDQTVSESVLPKCVAAARSAVGGSARQQVIATVHGRGYRFVATVQQRLPEDSAVSAADAPARAGSRQVPFVGRNLAMEQLLAGFAAACSGQGGMFLLVGEPGIGKSRTADEFAAEVRRRDGLVFVGRAYEGEGAPAFWPWVQVLRARVAAANADALASDVDAAGAEVTALLPELRAQVPNLPPPPSIEGSGARFRLFDSVTTFLRRTAARRPLVIILDDLHWADEASLQLLRFLAGEIADARLLVLATYRDVEVRRGHPLAEILGALARQAGCVRIALRGFEITETARLIGSLLGQPPSETLAAAVHEMTEGNPFFIQEVVRLLEDEDRLGGVGAQPALTLPQSVRDAIGRRLSGLSASCNEVLRAAAVLGREVNAAVVARVAVRPIEEVLEYLRDAASAQILDEVGGLRRYAFHHALIRQTLYEELRTPERISMHRRAAEAIEEVAGADATPYLDELAHHYFEAAPGGDVTRAVDTCTRAAERAFRQLAWEQSARQYERALEVQELQQPRDEVRHCELLLALGTARAAGGERDAGRAASERAAEIARALSRADLLAAAALGDRGATEMGTPSEASTLALLEEALVAIGDDYPALRARLLSRLTGTPPYSDSMEKRDQLSREAVQLATSSADVAALRDALGARLWACLGPDRLDERFAVVAQILDLAAEQRDPLMALLGYEGLVAGHLLRGDMLAAERAMSAYDRAARELRQPVFLFLSTFTYGSRAVARGEFAEAERLFRDALALGRGAVPYAHFMYAGQMYPLHYLRGVEEDAELDRVFFGEMMELPYSWEPAVRSALAFAHVLRGDPEAGRRGFDGLAQHGFEDIRRDEHWLVTLGTLSQVAMILPDQARAERLYELLSPYADLIFVHALLRSIGNCVACALGGLATTLERYDDGVAHYERGMTKEAAMGNVTALAESRLGYARLLYRRHRPGDRQQADRLVAETKTTMAALGIRRHWQLIMLEADLARRR